MRDQFDQKRQDAIIANLTLYGPMTRDELVKRLAMPRSTIYGTLKKLLSQKMIKSYRLPQRIGKGRPQTYFRLIDQPLLESEPQAAVFGPLEFRILQCIEQHGKQTLKMLVARLQTPRTTLHAHLAYLVRFNTIKRGKIRENGQSVICYYLPA